MANRLQQRRLAQGLSQVELARRAGISRQALGAIESGLYQPGVSVALGLARELGATVEELFGAPQRPKLVAHALGADARSRGRVGLARVGGRLIAAPLAPQHLMLATPGGAVLRSLAGNRLEIEPFRSSAEIERTLIVAGCDPAIVLVRDFLLRRAAPIEIAPIFASSRDALAALARGAAHLAGVHLRDPKGGDYNQRAAHRAMGARAFRIVKFARWELGLASRPDRTALATVADLTRRGVRMINREPGAGARAALDEELTQAGIESSKLTGYDRFAGGHLEVAAAIARGEADAGVTIRLAADLNGLRFQPWREERYDLIVGEREWSSPPVIALLEALHSRELARQIESLCAYDSREMGAVSAASA